MLENDHISVTRHKLNMEIKHKIWFILHSEYLNLKKNPQFKNPDYKFKKK